MREGCLDLKTGVFDYEIRGNSAIERGVAGSLDKFDCFFDGIMFGSVDIALGVNVFLRSAVGLPGVKPADGSFIFFLVF